jgi:2-dehydro-3-deoxygalactonokinase
MPSNHPHQRHNGPYIAVDWGTTNRRAYLLDAAHNCVDSFEDDHGVLAVPVDGFPNAVAAIRQRLGQHPVLLGGMVGSNRGWVSVPYVAAPTQLTQLAAAIHWLDAQDIGIVPGISLSGNDRADVMRGEEIQAFGAVAAGLAASSGTICLPGTHAKWVTMDDGSLSTFQTAMTGEVFALLKSHSILSSDMQGPIAANAHFAAGVSAVLAGGNLLSLFFGVRARSVLGLGSDGAAFASGVLIGSDVRAGAALAGAAPITLVGRPALCELYAVALALAGRPASVVDGGDAFRAGIRAVLEAL